MSVRVVIADDQEMVRTGFRLILSRDAEIEVVADAADGALAVAVVREVRPDVVLMDIRMPVLDGLEATRRIVSDPACPSRVLVLTTFDHDEYVYEALAAGASGFLLKDAPATDLVHAIKVVASGESILAPVITTRLIREFGRSRPHAADVDAVARLTDRERDVLVKMAAGLTNAEIAAALFVGEATVKTHVTRILQKLGCRDRVQVVIVAHRAGIDQ